MRRCLGCMEEFSEEFEICPHCGYEVGRPPKEAYHMIPGTVLKNKNHEYLIGGVLGFGGFGVTYIGYDQTLMRKVAVKEYLPGEFSTRIPGQTQIITYEGKRTEQFNGGLDKFIEEAKMLAKFEATNGVVQIYDSFRENGTAYIVMEYLEGRTLKTHLEKRGKLSVEEAKEILQPILTALKEVHGMGILHRDIAPDNIFLTEDGKVKLLDFGASRFATTSHSKSLSVIIKPGFAPVEQYRSRGDQGPWTDVYSLAATFYYMVTGIIPEDAMERVEKEELKKPSKTGVSIPKNVEHAVMNALNIKIQDRTQDIETFERELILEEKVKLKFVHLKKADVGKWPLWSKIAVSAAALATAVFAGLIATGVIDYSRLIPEGFALPEGMTRVPNLVNSEVATAEATMTEAELILQIVDKQYSEYIPQDLVLSQDLSRGKIVSIEKIVEVVVSGGQEVVIMEDVRGYYKEEAITRLSAIGIAIEIKEEYSGYAEGAVMAQSVLPGEKVYRGSTVVLTISKGYDTFIDTEQEVTIPDITGMTMENALAELKNRGLYIVKTDVREAAGKRPGSILEQTPAPGTKGHQGDIIQIVLVAETTKLYMPDTQYKDAQTAKAELEKLGLKVTVVYEESSTVAKDKVIRQSIAAYEEVKAGTAVTLVVSSGTELINQIVEKNPQWSEWAEALPAGVSKSNYEIETKKQYSFRDKSTTSSRQENMPGWTLYDKTTTKENYGEWSTWNTSQPTNQDGREIQEKVQYSYSDRETKISDQASESGWTLINTRTYYLEDYGAFSEWSDVPVEASDTRKMETRTLYQTRTRSREETTASTKTLDGWNYGSRTEGTPGDWSGWSRDPITASESESGRVVVETRQMTEEITGGYKYSYNYYHYRCETDKGTAWFSFPIQAGTSNSGYTAKSNGERGDWTSDTPLPSGPIVGHVVPGTTAPIWFSNCCGRYLGKPFEVATPITENRSYTEYRSCRIPYTYSFWRMGAWSDWSGWSEAEAVKSDIMDVDKKSQYRYADKIPHYEYTYERWTDSSAWSDTPVTASSTRRVNQQTIYKYRDKMDTVTYHFYQWGSWSDYRDEKTDASNMREVRERAMYRYREK